MAKPKGENKPAHSKPAALRVLPMNLQVGDVLAAEIPQWRVIGRPHTPADGKTVNVRASSP